MRHSSHRREGESGAACWDQCEEIDRKSIGLANQPMGWIATGYGWPWFAPKLFWRISNWKGLAMAKRLAISGLAAFEKFLRSIKVDKSHEHAEVLLLTCIDFRFFTLIAQKLNDEGLAGKYDHFILAGAALGATLDFSNAHLPAPQPPDCQCKPLLPRLHWQQVFIEHLQIALQLHATINRVVIIEHRECGAYKAFLQPAGYPKPTPKKDPERDAHKAQADKLEKIINTHFPKLRIDKWLAQLKPGSIGPLSMTAPSAIDSLAIESL